jgi:hypothetical protein
VLTDRRLSEIKAAGGAVKAALVGDREQAAQGVMSRTLFIVLGS